jgi:hypothetical protein
MRMTPSGGLRIPFLALGVLAMSSVAFSETPERPTFSKHIAPIFQEKCESCHRPGSIAPMPLRTFQESRPWARSIKARVETRQMPPWHIDKTIGIQEFKNDRSLSDEQIATIAKWVDAGAPEGDPADMPTAKKWPDGEVWNYAALFGQEPDMIVRSLPWTQKKGANDTWWKPVVEVAISEPRWVRAIEVRPGTVKGRKITHHANSDVLQDEPGELTQAGPGRFMEWAVGKEGEIMRPNTGKLLLPGSKILWDIHYSASNEDITDVVEMGIYFYPKGQVPEHRQHLLRMGNTGTGAVDIPPNSITTTETFFPLRGAARIESFQPHMHLRGKAMSLEAILPTGQTVILSHVDNFNFNWHSAYVYADDAAPLVPRGTVMKITAWHDNTAANKANPDPNVWVGYGDRTVDEMAHAWVNVTYLTDEDYLEEVGARRARLSARRAP